MQAVPGLVDQPGDRGQGHLLRQGQHQCLEQWREAGELAGTVRLNLDNPPFEQLHPRRLTSRQLGKITGCATAWCGRHGPDATIRHLAPQTGCRRQVKADLTTFSAASKSTTHPECVFTMSNATQHTRPTLISKSTTLQFRVCSPKTDQPDSFDRRRLCRRSNMASMLSSLRSK